MCSSFENQVSIVKTVNLTVFFNYLCLHAVCKSIGFFKFTAFCAESTSIIVHCFVAALQCTFNTVWLLRYIGEVGDVVIGRITEVGNKRWKVDAHTVLDSVLLLSCVNLPGGELVRRSNSYFSWLNIQC